MGVLIYYIYSIYTHAYFPSRGTGKMPTPYSESGFQNFGKLHKGVQTA